jgi:UDP-N-acetylmuramoylalanine--D-glutamate ligase
VRSGTLEQAMADARERAEPGDVILLSPACASFDQFENYEARGAEFRRLA